MIPPNAAPRVALLADTFHETNGAARTCREWEAFAMRRQLPFFCARVGPVRSSMLGEHVCQVEIPPSWLAFPVDTDLRFDPCFYTEMAPLLERLRAFSPDVIHITSPGSIGILGAILAAKLRVPLALSWHTNLHEFAARRANQTLAWLPSAMRGRMTDSVERFVLDRVCWFFKRGDILFAPNPELMALLEQRTGKPVFPMRRGVDTTLFHPVRRTRLGGRPVLGFVGRLMPEKNLRLLAGVDTALRDAGLGPVTFQITGAGSERDWLAQHLPTAEFTGVLHGEALARAYANMDLFLFPSRTDTFGNVVQEAMASGVPALVMAEGGPRFIVRDGETGFVAHSEQQFHAIAVELLRNPSALREAGAAARGQVENESWDRVFERVYEAYAGALGLN